MTKSFIAGYLSAQEDAIISYDIETHGNHVLEVEFEAYAVDPNSFVDYYNSELLVKSWAHYRAFEFPPPSLYQDLDMSYDGGKELYRRYEEEINRAMQEELSEEYA
jgi:hypothetical protein